MTQQPLSTEVDWMESGFTEKQIKHRGVVCLDDKEEDLFDRYPKQGRSNDDMVGVSPDTTANKVGIPGSG